MIRVTKTALVTGGAGGIGFELCKLIAQEGYDIVMVDMNEVGMARAAAQLNDMAGIAVHTIVKDLSRQESAREIVAELEERGIAIDLLINNAGFGLTGRFVDIGLEAQLNMLHVNISAVVALTRLLLPGMLQRKSAAILNVASIAAFQPGPYMSAYFASKAFVLSWSESLGMELEGTGVTVTTLCPPPTDTGFARRAGAGTSIAFRKGLMATPEEVAREAWIGLKMKKVIVLPCLLNKVAVFTGRFLPRKAVTAIAGAMNRQRATGAADGLRIPRRTQETIIPRAV